MKLIDYKGAKWVHVSTFVFSDPDDDPIKLRAPEPTTQIDTMRATIDSHRVEIICETDLKTNNKTYKATIAGDPLDVDAASMFASILAAKTEEQVPTKPKPNPSDVTKVINKLTGTKDGTQIKT